MWCAVCYSILTNLSAFPHRVCGWLVWLSSIVMFLTSNIVFSVLIHIFCERIGETKFVLVVLRVVTLDGLFLAMGFALAVYILIVSTEMHHVTFLQCTLHTAIMCTCTFTLLIHVALITIWGNSFIWVLCCFD